MVYQKDNASGEAIAPKLELCAMRNLTIAQYNIPIQVCNKPKPCIAKRTHEFQINTIGAAVSYEPTTPDWVIASALSKKDDESKIPGWAGCMSLVSCRQSLTKVGATELHTSGLQC